MSIFVGDTTPNKVYVGDSEASSVRVGDTKIRPVGVDKSWVFYDMTTTEFNNEFSWKNKCALSTGYGIIPSGASSDEAWYCSKLLTTSGSDYNVIEASIQGLIGGWSWFGITFYGAGNSTTKGRYMFGLNGQNAGYSGGSIQYDLKGVNVYSENSRITRVQNHDDTQTEYSFRINLDTGATVIKREGIQVASGTASANYLNSIKSDLSGNVYIYIGGEYAGGTNVIQKASVHLGIE